MNIILLYNVGACKKIDFFKLCIIRIIMIINGQINLHLFLLRLKYNNECLFDLLLIKLESDIIFLNITEFQNIGFLKIILRYTICKLIN